MRCSICQTEYNTPFCPNGCNTPTAPYITQRQQDEQGCPFCGSRQIQVFRETVEKKRLFGRGTKTKQRLLSYCAACKRSFR